MTEVLDTDLPTSGNVARVVINGALAFQQWHAALRIATPQVIEPVGVRSASGDQVRYDFVVSSALVGKPFELDVYADGQPRQTIARGQVVEGAGELVAAVTFAELEQQADTPSITFGDVPPSDPEVGDVWHDTTAPTIFVGGTQPESPELNDIWLDTLNT